MKEYTLIKMDNKIYFIYCLYHTNKTKNKIKSFIAHCLTTDYYSKYPYNFSDNTIFEEVKITDLNTYEYLALKKCTDGCTAKDLVNIKLNILI